MKNDSVKTLFLFAGPILAMLFCLLIDLEPGRPQTTTMAAIAMLMAFWWITEAVPLSITALLPIVLFPLFGIMNGKAVSAVYINHIIFLFIGGFLMALAMQRWQLHRRIALSILLLFGGKPALIMLGFMLTTAFLSMWISNTATAMLMVPIVLAIVVNLEEQFGAEKVKPLSIGLFLSIAYSASIGGIATLIGTPPNLSFTRILAITFPHAPEISFANWLFFALPITALLFAFVWLLLYLLYIPKQNRMVLDTSIFRDAAKTLGPIQREEKIVFTAFICMALLWVFRSPIDLGFATLPGWSQLLPYPALLNDGTVAIAVSLLLFVIPAQAAGEKILDEQVFSKLPWHIIFLFGGGFALASGFIESGLSEFLAGKLQGLQGADSKLLVLCITLMVTFMTELTSNTTTTEMLLPVLAAMAVAIQTNPLLLMVPATLSASCAFMLPVATPPNAIVFGTNRVRVIDMVKTGLLINLVGAALITALTFIWGPRMLDIDTENFPAWATNQQNNQ
ncbi:MAG: SLC13/DASS family transporter [Pseudomonadales bacterium]|nr:SLC13/DASS family transporter [Pseudomonadales bacterium]